MSFWAFVDIIHSNDMKLITLLGDSHQNAFFWWIERDIRLKIDVKSDEIELFDLKTQLAIFEELHCIEVIHFNQRQLLFAIITKLECNWRTEITKQSKKCLSQCMDTRI